MLVKIKDDTEFNTAIDNVIKKLEDIEEKIRSNDKKS